MLSAPMAQQELDRYTFNSPGQAGSYFYGYSRILQLRAETESRWVEVRPPGLQQLPARPGPAAADLLAKPCATSSSPRREE
jgi:hypothetical protein